MEELVYLDRRNTSCEKWDGQTGKFGEEGLHAMWVADMDFKVPACVQEALQRYVEEGLFGYYKIPDTYYQAFIDWEEKHHGYEVERKWIRFSPGVVCAFHWIVQIMTEPGDAVIVTTPVYFPFLDAVRNNNRKLITSDLVNTDGEYSIDFDDFERKIEKEQVKLFILCSPHNPVGRVWKREELERLFEICRRHGVFVISDEIHQDLTREGYTHVPSLSVGDYHDMMISITAPSKTFNLAGGQNSIVVIPDETVRARWDAFIKGIRVISGNAFGYIAAEAAYKGGADWLLSIRAQIDENFRYLKETMQDKLPKVRVTTLQGTYLAWVDLGAYVPADEMKEFMQKKCRLAVDYGDWFGGEQFATFIRMNLATSLENVKIGVDAIVKNLTDGQI